MSVRKGTRARPTSLDLVRSSVRILSILPEHSRFTEVIVDRRLELGLRQADVAQAIGCRDSMVGKMENGTRYPDLTSLPAIASVLRIDLTLLTLCFLNQRAPEIADAFRRTMHKPRIIQMLEALPRALKTTVHDMIQDLYREEISLAQTAKRA